MDQREQPYAGPPPDVDPDPEWTEYLAWQDGEIAAGRDPAASWAPQAWEPEDWESGYEADPSLPAGAARGLRFGQGDEADALPPGPRLVGLTEEAVQDFAVLSDNELIGVLLAARRQEMRETCKQTLAIAEFARRREAAFEEAKARGVPRQCSRAS